MSLCNLCPRRCNTDRSKKTGFCGQSDAIRVARAAPHFWEEPCLSGKNGSGTVFFCGCTLGCVYCQNSAISRGNTAKHGITVDPHRLADVFMSLQDKGVHNINLVTPTMFAPDIAKAIDISRAMGLSLPIVYNTGGYEHTDALYGILDKIDVYLPDFKYLSTELSEKYSNAADYPIHAKSSLKMAVKHIGDAAFDAHGIMKKGVIVRHLLLPGLLSESKKVLDYLFSEYGNTVYYSLMSQYTPMPTLDAARYPELNRRVTTYEYDKLIEYAVGLGIKNGFIQDGASARESFIPSFDGEGV